MLYDKIISCINFSQTISSHLISLCNCFHLLSHHLNQKKWKNTTKAQRTSKYNKLKDWPKGYRKCQTQSFVKILAKLSIHMKPWKLQFQFLADLTSFTLLFCSCFALILLLFYFSVLFYSILFYSVLFCSVLFFALLCFVSSSKLILSIFNELTLRISFI